MLNYVQPDHVPSVWRSIRANVQKCIDQDTDDCLIEDVYYFVRSGMASLYVCPDGFCVLQRAHDPYSGKPRILIWLAYCKDKESTKICVEEIKQQARDLGCDRVIFKNYREAFDRLNLGFKKGETEYMWEIT